MSANWNKQSNIRKKTYKFPSYIPKFHGFPHHSSPTLLPHISPLINIYQFQQHLSLHNNYLTLHHNHSLHQQSPPLLHHILSLHYIY